MRLQTRGVLVVALVGWLAGCTAAAPDSTPSPSGDAPIEDLDGLGALAIESTPFPDWLMATPQGVWAANVGDGLVRYDDEGTVTASVSTDEIPLAMEVGFGSLWVGSIGAAGSRVLRVDLQSGSIQAEIPTPQGPLAPESSIAVTDTGVWAIVDPGETRLLIEIDPATDTIATEIPAPKGAAALRGGFGSLWLSRNVGAIDRLDPATGATLSSVEVGGDPRFMSAGAGAVWVQEQAGGSVLRLDPETGELIASVLVDAGGLPGGDIVATDAGVWVRATAELAAQIDPATNSVARRIGSPAGSGSIALAADALWISAHDVRTVWRVPLD